MLELDLSPQMQVRKAAEEVNSYVEPIDVLTNNSAIMAVPYSKTMDGQESQFGTNHIGHFLFTNLITPKLLAAERGARVINVSISGHKREQVRFDDYNFEVRIPTLLKPYLQMGIVVDSRRNQSRMAPPMTNGKHMARAKQLTCSSLSLWPKSLETKVCFR